MAVRMLEASKSLMQNSYLGLYTLLFFIFLFFTLSTLYTLFVEAYNMHIYAFIVLQMHKISFVIHFWPTYAHI